MKIKQNDIVIKVPDALIIDLAMQRLQGHTNQAKVINSTFPVIGTEWPGQGGIFGGLMRGRDGDKDYALILGPKLEEGTFKDVTQQAEALEHAGHKDYRLPYRNEQALLFANLKDQFQPEWYWSCERHPNNEVSAYAQYFIHGYQGHWYVNYTFLGVAVRVVII